MAGKAEREKNLVQADLFHRGLNFRAHELLGAHPHTSGRRHGFLFRTWAPNARRVAVVGSFNGWKLPGAEMEKITDEGIYEVFIPGVKNFDTYKYAVCTPEGDTVLKADPYAFHAETRPATASKCYDLAGYRWGDDAYIKARDSAIPYAAPMNIYEVQLGSFIRHADGNFYSYRDAAEKLAGYLVEMGYTHIELMPVTEYPYDGSWGYQVTGYFAPTSRFGTPHDFMYFVDRMHVAGIGVIVDWVPSHFPRDAFALAEYDGGHCYEDPNPRRGEHREWGTLVFDYGRREVQCFLISSAAYWMEHYHLDGLRVDAVASMLYLDYGRKDGEATHNTFGGNENLEAIDLLRKFNTEIFRRFPNALMIAEESTTWPMVTKPVDDGGLGFNFKWNMGWMNDTLAYMEMDPVFRKDHHNKVTFSMTYAFSENFVLPVSHDEVVYGKKSLIDKMPGSYAEKFGNLRAFMCYMMAHPGKKLLFMGQDFAQFSEWYFERELDWMLLEYEAHRNHRQFVKDLNHFYLAEPALFEIEDGWEGFRWVTPDDNTQNILVFLRRAKDGSGLLFAVNFSPVARLGYRAGVPVPGNYELVFSSERYDPAGDKSRRRVYLSEPVPSHGFDHSVVLELPPLAGIFLRVPGLPVKG